MNSFNRHSTADEVARGTDLSGKRVVINGASSGIGAAAANAMASAGAHVTLGVRDIAAGHAVADGLSKPAARRATVLPLDLADLGSVSAFADRVSGPVDLLIANAGVSKTPDTHLSNGLEVRFATNHLGHFLLANLLKEQMALRGARVVVVSSAAHKGLPVRLDDLNWHHRPHSLQAYGESKSANILFALEATRRWRARGIFANAVLPGSALTGLQRYHGEEMKRRIGFILPDGSLNPALKTIEQAAATTVWAAVSPALAGRGGLILEDCAEALPVEPATHAWSGVDLGVADAEAARLLWEESVNLIITYGGEAMISR